jgi:putative tryptophan/tyrosine transport system substrate-binding protein
MIPRRSFLLLGIGALWGGMAPAALGQPAKPWRIGFIYVGTRQSAMETGRYDAFLAGMRELGHVEGRDFIIHAKYSDADEQRYRLHSAALIQEKVDLIVSTATPIHRVLRELTSTIPIVITVSPDPVGEGLAASLARPGGNVTGLTSSNAELSWKYFELLSASVPKIARIGVLYNSANATHPRQLKNAEAAIRPKNVTVVSADARRAGDIPGAIGSLARERVDAAIILADGLFVQQAGQVAELAVKHRLPTIYGTSEYPLAGGMMSYGPDIAANYRRAAYYVDRILKGAKPGELPIEQPTRFDLVINVKAALAVGVRIPASLLARADRVID